MELCDFDATALREMIGAGQTSPLEVLTPTRPFLKSLKVSYVI